LESNLIVNDTKIDSGASEREGHDAPGTAVPPMIWNVPNLFTALRFVLSVVVFVMIPWGFYSTALVVFVIAASTDWVDGYWARRFGQVTRLGRIFDPFVDKIIICGVFIFLASEEGSGIVAWMAVVVVARELLVTALRGFIEQRGGDFSAKMSGKLKMVFQFGQDVRQAEDGVSVRRGGIQFVRIGGSIASLPSGVPMVVAALGLGGRAADHLLGGAVCGGRSPSVEKAASLNWRWPPLGPPG